MKGEEFDLFLAAMRAYADRSFLEVMEEVNSGVQFLLAIIAKRETLVMAIEKAEQSRKGWHTKANRRRWIDKFGKIGTAAFDVRICELLMRAAAAETDDSEDGRAVH